MKTLLTTSLLAFCGCISAQDNFCGNCQEMGCPTNKCVVQCGCGNGESASSESCNAWDMACEERNQKRVKNAQAIPTEANQDE